jgi:hypothetical protein
MIPIRSEIRAIILTGALALGTASLLAYNCHQELPRQCANPVTWTRFTYDCGTVEYNVAAGYAYDCQPNPSEDGWSGPREQSASVPCISAFTATAERCEPWSGEVTRGNATVYPCKVELCDSGDQRFYSSVSS